MSRGDFQYELKMVNGSNGDPVVFLFFPHMVSGMLFDLGLIDAISNRDLLKVKHVFVTHTHVDHFIGFDRLLRVNIPHFRLVNLYGPPGFIDNVAAKLQGYTWNLLEPGQIRFRVRELHQSGEVFEAILSNDNHFQPYPIKIPSYETRSPHDGKTVVIERFPDHGYVEAVLLDHGTPSMAFRYQAPPRYRIDMEKVTGEGLKEGAWIRQFQVAVQEGHWDSLIDVEGKKIKVLDLSRNYMVKLPPFSVAYMTDFVFNLTNVHRCLDLLRGTSLLIAESSFKHEDRTRAAHKKHLTTYQSAMIAALSEVRWYRTFHVSGIYGEGEEVEVVIDEAQRFWNQLQELSENGRTEALHEELNAPLK